MACVLRYEIVRRSCHRFAVYLLPWAITQIVSLTLFAMGAMLELSSTTINVTQPILRMDVLRLPGFLNKPSSNIAVTNRKAK